MTNNEPFQAIANAYRMKMFRAVEAKKTHQNMVRYFNEIANYNRKNAIEFGTIVMFNKTGIISKFWERVESCS